MKKLIKKIKNFKKKTKDFFAKIKENQAKRMRNIRYEIRYNNLLKKYEEMENEIKVVNDKLDNDKNLQRIDYLRKIIERKNKIIKELNEEIKMYDEIKRNLNSKQKQMERSYRGE